MPSQASFLKIVENAIVKERADRKEKAKDYEYRHNPSSASLRLSSGKVAGACLRALYYKATKQPESNPTDYTGFLQMGFGDAIHTWFMAQISKSKDLTFTSETGGKLKIDPLKNEVSYRLDGIATINGERGGFELKTQQNFAIERMVRGEGPKVAHLAQIRCYFEVDPSLQWFSLVYVSRDSALRAEYQVVRDGEGLLVIPINGNAPIRHKDITFKAILERWYELEQCIAKSSPPERDYKVIFSDSGKIVPKRTRKGVDYKSDFMCNYCSYKDYCWSLPDAKEASLKLPE